MKQKDKKKKNCLAATKLCVRMEITAICGCFGEATGASLDQIIEAPMGLCVLFHWQHCKTKSVADYFYPDDQLLDNDVQTGDIKGHTQHFFPSK